MSAESVGPHPFSDTRHIFTKGVEVIVFNETDYLKNKEDMVAFGWKHQSIINATEWITMALMGADPVALVKQTKGLE